MGNMNGVRHFDCAFLGEGVGFRTSCKQMSLHSTIAAMTKLGEEG